MTKKSQSLMATSKHPWAKHCKHLYAAGFRLVETDVACNMSSEVYLLVHRPHFIPNFQVEDGVVRDHIETTAVLDFCLDLIGAINDSVDGKQEVNQIQESMKMLKDSSILMSNVIRPSFPWNGL